MHIFQLKKKRKRKLQGTYCDLTKVAPAFRDSINQISLLEEDSGVVAGELTATSTKERWPSESSGVFTASEMSQCTSPANGEQQPAKAR